MSNPDVTARAALEAWAGKDIQVGAWFGCGDSGLLAPCRSCSATSSSGSMRTKRAGLPSHFYLALTDDSLVAYDIRWPGPAPTISRLAEWRLDALELCPDESPFALTIAVGGEERLIRACSDHETPEAQALVKALWKRAKPEV